jgi:hypothetical protein
MFEKDYLMRLVNTFFNALNRIINSIEKDDIENVRIQIIDAYKLLGNDSSFFLNTNLDKIFLFFKEKEGNYLKRVNMLAELMYQDSRVNKKKETKNLFLDKSILLFEYYIENTKEYSFGLNRKLHVMKNERERL